MPCFANPPALTAFAGHNCICVLLSPCALSEPSLLFTQRQESGGGCFSQPGPLHMACVERAQAARRYAKGLRGEEKPALQAEGKIECASALPLQRASSVFARELQAARGNKCFSWLLASDWCRPGHSLHPAAAARVALFPFAV